MNFHGFDDELPGDWEARVLHEFGHALGFDHEHQGPMSPCEDEFHWEDDPGYIRTEDIYHQYIPDGHGRRPGVYTIMEGAPNRWDRKEVDWNLRKLPNSSDWLLSSFDKLSIMKYYFDARLFKNGSDSACYSQKNLVLSALDRKAASDTYPRALSDINRELDAIRVADQDLINLKNLPPDLKLQYENHLKTLKEGQKARPTPPLPKSQ